MNFKILTLFPDMIEQAANTSILGRAIKNGCIDLDIINIRDYSANKHNRVDDYPYGGGAGMVIEAEPVFRAVAEAKKDLKGSTKVVYLTPQAKVLDQVKVEELACEDNLILLCGHYEGIDDRVLQEVVTDYISIGDYVLTGGELGALVLMDAVSRFVPGVLNNEESTQFESLQDNLLEYPHYTRPEVWHGKKVPEVLLSGDHVKINQFRYEQSVLRTQSRREDLMKKHLNVNIVSFGSDNAKENAALFSEKISRYGTVLDYNRNKLKKEKRIFKENDLVIFFTDSEGALEAEAFADMTRKMGGSGSHAFFVLDKCGSGREKALMLKDMLHEKNLKLTDAYNADDSDCSRDYSKTALYIKSAVQYID